MKPMEILEFWFGPILENVDAISEERLRLWFGKGSQTDRLIEDRFGPVWELAAQGELDSWLIDPAGRLALIIVLDQFSRNIFRGMSRAFDQDQQALKITLAGIAIGDDLHFAPIGRAFFYMPLEHSEDLLCQERSVKAYAELRQAAPAAQKASFESFYDYAIRHRNVIARFGRFPHRNEILGRMSSPEEQEFLQWPGSSF